MAGRRPLEVRDLALHPDVEELGLEDALDPVGELGDGEGASAVGPRFGEPAEVQSLLLHRVSAFYHGPPRPAGPGPHRGRGRL